MTKTTLETPRLAYACRWFVEAPGLEGTFAKRVKFEFVKNVLDLHLYDIIVPEDHPHNIWITKPQGPITFVACDESGKDLYGYVLYGPQLVSSTAVFDYCNAEPVIRELTIKYSHLLKKDLLTNERPIAKSSM